MDSEASAGLTRSARLLSAASFFVLPCRWPLRTQPRLEFGAGHLRSETLFQNFFQSSGAALLIILGDGLPVIFDSRNSKFATSRRALASLRLRSNSRFRFRISEKTSHSTISSAGVCAERHLLCSMFQEGFMLEWGQIFDETLLQQNYPSGVGQLGRHDAPSDTPTGTVWRTENESR